MVFGKLLSYGKMQRLSASEFTGRQSCVTPKTSHIPTFNGRAFANPFLATSSDFGDPPHIATKVVHENQALL